MLFFIVSILSNRRKYYLVLVHATVVSFAISVTVTGFITDFLKNFIGRLRPDFLDRCRPREGTPTDVYVDSSVCTNTDLKVIHDGFKSIPSGHTSMAFACFYFLSLWLAGQFGVFSHSSRFLALGNTIKALLCLGPILFASYVALSRTEDYRHRGSDIIAGTLIGVIVAWISYRLFFPPLASDDSDTPYVLDSWIAYEHAKAHSQGRISVNPDDMENQIEYDDSSRAYRNASGQEHNQLNQQSPNGVQDIGGSYEMRDSSVYPLDTLNQTNTDSILFKK